MLKQNDHEIFAHRIHYIFFMVTIIIIAAIGFFASDIYLPSLPSIAKYFQKSSFEVQLTMSAFLLSMAIFQVFIGALSDKFGRKKILAIFIFIFILASFGCFQAHSLRELILFRALQGVGTACGLSIGHAIIADVFTPLQAARAFSIVIPMVAFSPAIAPILGGIIEESSNWRYIFLFLCGYGTLILILLSTPIIPKLNKKEPPKIEKSPSVIYKIIKDKEFIGFALMMMNANASYFGFLATAPYLLNKFGYSPTEIGYAFCAASFPYMAASFMGRKLSFRLSHLQIIFMGLLFNIAGAICMLIISTFHWPHMASLMIPIFIITVGNGLLMPFSSASAVALYPRNSGLITGSLATLQLCAASFGNFIMGVFNNGTLYSLALYDVIITHITIIYFIFLFGKKIKKAKI